MKLEKEPASVVEHRSMSRSRCAMQQHQQQARTFGGGAAVHAPRLQLKDSDKHSVRPSIGASTNRWFATARDEPADSDSDSDSDSEFESTIFGGAPEPAAASPAADEPPAAKKTSKGWKPRKRRSSKSKSAPSAETAAEAEEATAAAAAAAEATAAATKKPRARKPRKKRRSTSTGGSTPSPPAEPAEGSSTAPEEEAEGDADEEEEEEEEEEEVEVDSGVGIPKTRKAAFERARRAGVTQRAREAGVPLLDGDGSGRSGSEFPWSGEEEEEEEEEDSGDDVARSPSSWQEPVKPVRPEGFPFSASAEGSANVSAWRGSQAPVSMPACML